MSRYEFYKTLIIASLIEREERFKPEQTGVSGVIYNRIAAQMPLGIDATTCYAFEISQKQCTPKFIGDHIYENTPYNTRTQQ